MDLNPSGEDVPVLASEALAQPKDVIERLKKLMGKYGREDKSRADALSALDFIAKNVCQNHSKKFYHGSSKA